MRPSLAPLSHPTPLPRLPAGEHGGQEGAAAHDAASFLLGGNSMFRPLMEILFARLPPALRRRAVRRVAAFLAESTFTSGAGGRAGEGPGLGLLSFAALRAGVAKCGVLGVC